MSVEISISGWEVDDLGSIPLKGKHFSLRSQLQCRL
jgi:hypothetical protein